MATAFGELVGRVLGAALAPITAGVSAARRSRMFHPCGSTYRAEVLSAATDPAWERLARALEGHALVRFSGAWWKTREWPDVLGCAIRFTRELPIDERPHEGDQDLLLATIRRPWTMPFAPLTTRQHDYLDNHYYGVAPFASEAGQIEWRLVPSCECDPEAAKSPLRRDERLEAAIARREVALTLEARPYRRLVDVRPIEWSPVARLELLERVELDARAIRFDPFRDGRGIRPAGLVHALRIATYGAGQAARPSPAAT